jgi:hypothetical protein
MTTRSTWLTIFTLTQYIHHTLPYKEYYEVLYIYASFYRDYVHI